MYHTDFGVAFRLDAAIFVKHLEVIDNKTKGKKHQKQTN